MTNTSPQKWSFRAFSHTPRELHPQLTYEGSAKWTAHAMLYYSCAILFYGAEYIPAHRLAHGKRV